MSNGTDMPVRLLSNAFSIVPLLPSSAHYSTHPHVTPRERIQEACSSHSVHDVRRPARMLAVRASPGEAAFIDYLPGLGNRPQVLPITAYINCKP